MGRVAALLIGCLVFALMPVSGSQASIVVDQSQTLNTTAFAQVILVAGQTFIPSFNNVAGARIGLANNAVADTITISLYDMPGTSGTQLATGTVSGPFNGNSFVEVLFQDTNNNPSPYLVQTPGTELFLVFTGTSPVGNQSTSFFGAHEVVSGGPYASGSAFANATQTNELEFANFDLAFQTLSDETITAVPEPSSAALLVLLVGAATIRRNRR